MMNRIKLRAAALFASAAMLLSIALPVCAEEFADPAQAYADYITDVGKIEDGELSADDPTTVGDTDLRTETPSEAPEGTGVKVPAEEITVYSFRSSITIGETYKIGYKLKPAESDDYVTYTVSNTATVSVAADGTVKGLKPGTAIVTARTSSGVKDRFSVTVKADPDEVPEDDDSSPEDSGSAGATAIELDRSAVTLTRGETYQIKYALRPEGVEDTAKFSSGESSIATVDNNGLVTAKKPGTVRIRCYTGSGAFTRLNVTVVEAVDNDAIDEQIEQEVKQEFNENGDLIPSRVRFADESVAIGVGEEKQLDARIYPSGCVYTYEIMSSDTTVVTVSHGGVITGLAAGNAVITLTTDNGKSDDIYVTVYDDVIKGIDVSKWNGDIDWEQVKKTGRAQFAMIRASYGYEDTDYKLEENVRGCEAYNIPYGFYHYTYAKNVSEARKEAAYFLNVISPYSPSYPIVLDIEEDFYKQMDRQEVTDIITTFMEACEEAGYYTMVYSFAKFFEAEVYMDQLMDYDIWVACWGDSSKLDENYSYHYGMWQYSETGTMAGIPEDVDLNYAYKDYSVLIRRYGLNNLQ